MRYIKKSIANEPATLREYRNSTPNARYVGYVDKERLSADEESRLKGMGVNDREKFLENKKNPLKKAICKEQGFICCYCMARISTDAMSVEHYVAQAWHQESPFSADQHLKQELEYMNLLGSCQQTDRDCSGIRGKKPLRIDPRKTEVESLIKFHKSGIVYSENEYVDLELNEVLKLNPKRDANGDLIVQDPAMALVRKRRQVVEKARERMRSYGSERTWTSKAILNEIQYWTTPVRGQYLPFYMAAVHYLRSKILKAQ